MYTVAFTGHRPDKLGGYGENPLQSWVRNQMRDRLQALKPGMVISGMALGVDQWAAEICIELALPFTAAIPFEGQEGKWPLNSQLHYRKLLEEATLKHVVSPGGYAAWKMHKRNQWMVDTCSTLIAIWDGSSGGTAGCVEYAKKVGRDILLIDPTDFQRCAS